MTSGNRICQVAFSVLDVRRADEWFRVGLGLIPAGGTRSFRGPLAEHVQGLRRAASTCWWLVGRDDFVQLELFQFERPAPRPRAADATPADLGYSRVGFWVTDLDATLARLARLGSVPLAPVRGDRGDRRVALRAPDGFVVVLFERDPHPGRPTAVRPEAPAAPRTVTLSVESLDAAVDSFVEGFGLTRSAVRLHDDGDEALWGLDGARRRTAVLEAGDLLLELVEYESPRGRPRAADYRISDQGILNVALGFRGPLTFTRTYRRATARGGRPNGYPLHAGTWGVTYVNDPQGVSVELLWVHPIWDSQLGLAPAPEAPRPPPEREAQGPIRGALERLLEAAPSLPGGGPRRG
ncbi:MAG: VOC family protein [Deltaproteobacteria bacterium]|nr:VOC family protein [Deltaproteobacteria bacterium]